MLYTSLYAVMVGAMLELGENIYRFDTEPFMMVMLALFLAFVFRGESGKQPSIADRLNRGSPDKPLFGASA